MVEVAGVEPACSEAGHSDSPPVQFCLVPTRSMFTPQAAHLLAMSVSHTFLLAIWLLAMSGFWSGTRGWLGIVYRRADFPAPPHVYGGNALEKLQETETMSHSYTQHARNMARYVIVYVSLLA